MPGYHWCFPLLAVGLTILLEIGCASLDAQPDYEQADAHIERATGQVDVYRPGDDDVAAETVRTLLGDGLTVREAVHVALLNNRRLQAAFYDIGVARADLVQSTLFSNPSLGLSLRLPAGGGLANIEASIAQNIADLWQIPVRKRAAKRSLDRAILELARLAANLAADAKVAYYQAVGAEHLYQITRENLGIAHELLEKAKTRQKLGAGNELEVNLSRSVVLDVKLAVEPARLAAADARRKLATLLGLTSNADALVLLDPLPHVPSKQPALDDLLHLARTRRLDILAARQEVMAAKARLQEQYRMVFPNVELGIAMERGERGRASGRKLLADTARSSIANGALTPPEIQPRSERQTNTDFIIGPSLGMEIPIFDQNQAQIAKAKLTYQQAVKTVSALDRSVSQEVRGVVDRALTAWRLARIYREQAIPLADKNLELSKKSYLAGKASFLAVLEAQRFFLDNRSRYVGASQAAAITIPELERTVGLPFEKLLVESDKEQANAPTTQPKDGE